MEKWNLLEPSILHILPSLCTFPLSRFRTAGQSILNFRQIIHLVWSQIPDNTFSLVPLPQIIHLVWSPDHTFSLVTDTRQYIQFGPLPRQYIQSWSPFPRAFIQSGPRYQTICTFSLIPFTRSYIQSGPHLGYQTILLVGSNSPDHIFSRVQFTRSYIQSGPIHQIIYLVWSNLPDNTHLVWSP